MRETTDRARHNEPESVASEARRRAARNAFMRVQLLRLFPGVRRGSDTYRRSLRSAAGAERVPAQTLAAGGALFLPLLKRMFALVVARAMLLSRRFGSGHCSGLTSLILLCFYVFCGLKARPARPTGV